ncbi:fungal specific transcription factor [Hirsutella rhossiliensis]|uniref:Fungal specific transcription factor domain-containing protein n=1 Tax=Hirsutella rhossiliensis TaxID=111463 RepID=A0A9P8SMN0_9HYPO|nr:fungal specific transcription factor domain-containing protein [Hirsutella rhossiliensis]KAH0967489.1 fungal specific transcription factor domain-containing protein [Hirsutella rhossiliensis]
MNSSSHTPSSSGPQHQPVVAVPRPQVSIERLPARHQNNEPRESMNCKSCRKRKIKCNRLRPACEACQIFQCPCIYDAIPKKRGPKTDVLEALLKRVDGLEAKLKDKNLDDSSSKTSDQASDEASEQRPEPLSKPPTTDRSPLAGAYYSTPRGSPASPVHIGALVHTYFTRFHGKPYYILDESSVRQRIRQSQLPDYLCYAICAVAARHTPLHHGQQAAAQLSRDYAACARRSLDTDEPSIDALQALLLLVLAFVASGKGKKAYMLMTSAIGMATALELNREVVDAQACITPVQRELRRRLFWTCYLLDRSLACGSKRPSLIRDKSIALRLPSWCPNASSPPIDGEFFQRGYNLQYLQGGKQSQGSTGMLIDIARILGITNRYLAAGGVKGDSHFPWHSLSTLSKIRQELDFWASGASDVFSTSIQALLGHPESTILMLSKLIYHLVHCLIYRPFLPIDLAELAGTGQHQSWQADATNMCFIHANSIAELVGFARQASAVEWPSLVGYCICTAATVHIHGAHYSNPAAGGEMNVFNSSADFLSAEMQQLRDLQHAWANVDHQRETLQGIYNAHGELVKALGGSTMRYTPAFHLEDFFDRYLNIGGPGGKSFRFDPAHLSLWSTVDGFIVGSCAGEELLASSSSGGAGRPSLKRKNPASASDDQRESRASCARESQEPVLPPTAVPEHTPYQQRVSQHPVASPVLLQPRAENTMSPQFAGSARHASYSASAATSGAAAPGVHASARTGFGTYNYGSVSISSDASHATPNDSSNSYDPVFGPLPTNAFWRGEDSQQHNSVGLLSSEAATPNVGKSMAGGRETAHADDKDPFLSLLEQLAEEEQRFNTGSGAELDTFLTPSGGSG